MDESNNGRTDGSPHHRLNALCTKVDAAGLDGGQYFLAERSGE